MKIKILICLSLLSYTSSCQDFKTKEKESKTQAQLNNMQIKINGDDKKNGIATTLEKQLNDGYKEEIVELEDMYALFDVETLLLKNNGYKEPTIEQFKDKIKLIFKKEINESNSFICFDIAQPCNMFNQNTWKNLDLKYMFFTSRYKFITDLLWLPEIFDYQKEYPELYKKEIHPEDADYRLWKDIENLSQQRSFNQQLVISRNKYLFNDDKSQFSWLINNDKDFMESLVTTFGYTEDKKLLNWVMDRNYNQAEDFVKNYVFVRNCQNKLEIREDILKYIEANTNDKEYHYATQLLNLYDRDNWKSWSNEEYYKILAYMANTFDPLSEKYSEVGMETHVKWTILGEKYYDSSPQEWAKLIQEFKKNNYYGLPNLKHAAKQAESYGDISIEVVQ